MEIKKIFQVIDKDGSCITLYYQFFIAFKESLDMNEIIELFHKFDYLIDKKDL